MGRRDRDFVLDRGEEKSPLRTLREAGATAPKAYRPGLALYLAPLFLLSLAASLVYSLATGSDVSLDHLFWGICMIVAALALPLVGWQSYRVDEHGVERRALGRSRRWSWEDIGGVHGHGVYTRGGYVVHYRVTDHEDRVLFRISPWIANRRELASRIRRQARVSTAECAWTQ